jgi:long-chain acyl-CoA synthetase
MKYTQVYQFLDQSAALYPDKPAVWYEGKWSTYSEIQTQSNQLARFLIEHGIVHGDRVALFMANSIRYIVAYYAILKAGAVVVSLNTKCSQGEFRFYMNDAECKALISEQRSLKSISGMTLTDLHLSVVITDHDLPEMDCRTGYFNIIFSKYDAYLPAVKHRSQDLESIVYTSGTTGRAKGVMLTHSNIIANTYSIVSYLHLKPEDRIMVILPFYYIYGKSLLNTHFSVGGSLVIDNRFAFPNTVLETMSRTDVTGFSGVPSTFLILLHKSMLRDYKFSKLRYLTQAGGPMPASVQRNVAEIFAPAELYIMYGATEASARLAYLDPKALPRKWGSIGKAIPNVNLFIVDESGEKVEPGREGEIVARGPNIFKGYWKDPDTTSKVLVKGCYYTGDLGKMDDEGFLYVTGRKSDFVKVGGEKVSTKEIEEHLLEIEDIAEAAVIGIEDEILGESISAYLVLKERSDITIGEVMKLLSGNLPAYKMPKLIQVLRELPKNEAGKVMKERLCNISAEILKSDPRHF